MPHITRKAANFRHGQSVLEVLIALGIMIAVIGAAIITVFLSQSSSVDVKLNQQALYIAQQSLETARAKARENFDSLASSSSTNGVFFVETLVETISDYTKSVTTTVKWSLTGTQTETLTLTTLLTDWKQALDDIEDSGGDSGGNDPSGDWTNPRTLGTVDLGPGNEGTDLDVIGKIVYMTGDAADSKKNDFYVIDATDGQNPVIQGQIDTGPGLLTIDAIVGFAFAGNSSTTEQLHVIDTSNPASPFVARRFTLPGVSGSGAIGNSVFFDAYRIYAGTKQATGPEFHVLDVSSPQNPVSLGAYELGADINGILTKDNYAYLATSDNAKELVILDVSNPASIFEAGYFNATGTDDGLSIYVSGSTLYLGRKKGSDKELYIFDISNPISASLLGTKEFDASIYDMRVRADLGFFGTDDANKEFQVWNVQNPANITLWSSFNFPQVANGVDYEDNLVYIAVRSNDALRIITSSP